MSDMSKRKKLLKIMADHETRLAILQSRKRRRTPRRHEAETGDDVFNLTIKDVLAFNNTSVLITDNLATPTATTLNLSLNNDGNFAPSGFGGVTIYRRGP